MVHDELKKESLVVNVKKCDFCMKNIVFLGYFVSKKGNEMDVAKVKVIIEWLKPKTISKVRSFYRLTSPYRRFVKYFRITIAPLTKIVNMKIHFK